MTAPQHTSEILAEFQNDPNLLPMVIDNLEEAGQLNAELAGGHARRGFQILNSADMGDSESHALDCVTLYMQMGLAEHFACSYPFASLEEIAQLIREKTMT